MGKKTVLKGRNNLGQLSIRLPLFLPVMYIKKNIYPSAEMSLFAVFNQVLIGVFRASISSALMTDIGEGLGTKRSTSQWRENTNIVLTIKLVK